jgi:hypothetical protein
MGSESIGERRIGKVCAARTRTKESIRFEILLHRIAANPEW